jgi:hypothetical protein
MRFAVWMVIFAACGHGKPDDLHADADGDHITASAGDCDDLDASIHPGAEEIWYDGIDQDCDGNDSDQDGDLSPVPDDCDDENAEIHAGAVDVLGDGLDADCDGNDGGAFVDWTLDGAALCGPSLDDAHGKVGIVVSSATNGANGGELTSRTWDATTFGSLGTTTLKFAGGEGDQVGLTALDHVEVDDADYRYVGGGMIVQGTDHGYLAGLVEQYGTGAYGQLFWSLLSSSPILSSSMRSSDGGITTLSCAKDAQVLMWGSIEDFETGARKTANPNARDVLRCAVTERDDVVMVQHEGDVTTYTRSDAGGFSSVTEAGWTALDSHDGHVLLGRDGNLELRVDGVPTDVPIEGVPTAVRLGGHPESGAWLAAWTTGDGAITLTVVGDDTRTIALDPGLGALDDFDVAWSPDGLLVVAARSGDSVRISMSVLR